MRATTVLALAVSVSVLALEYASGAVTIPPTINWLSCTDSVPQMTTPSGPAPPTPFQCADIVVPLCHDGICKSTKTISLFVKRILATNPTKPRKAMWFLAGGPGYTSVGMEDAMKGLSVGTASKVDMYTLDHRGVVRSTNLACQAAQAFAADIPSGPESSFPNIPGCIKDILSKIENKTEAFSVTSAAKDVAYLIDTLNGPDAEVFVYGGSYGSYWASRVMHLAPKLVRGYILDGVVDEKMATFSTWNKNRRYAEARFLKLCEKDKFCGAKFANEIKTFGGLSGAIQVLYKRFDTVGVGKNACADLARSLSPTLTPSQALKQYFSMNIQSDPTRIVVPALIYRLMRCNAADVAFLRLLFTQPAAGATIALAQPSATIQTDLLMSGSILLGSLIKASEMWATPSPSWDDELKSVDDGLFSMYFLKDFAMVCFLRGNFKDPMCRGLTASYPKTDFSKVQTTPFVYKPDAYWHKYAPIPSRASVMVINGGLDFQTPSEWGTAEYDGLRGGEKLLVEFDTGVHCAGIMPQTASDTSHCGARIISSYVLNGGNVGNVDTSCIGTLPAFDFTDLKAIQKVVKGVATVDQLYG